MSDLSIPHDAAASACLHTQPQPGNMCTDMHACPRTPAQTQTHTRTQAHMQTYMQTHTQTHRDMCTDTCIQGDRHTRPQTCTHTDSDTQTHRHSHIDAHTDAQMQTCTQTHRDMHTHTDTHTYMYTYRHAGRQTLTHPCMHAHMHTQTSRTHNTGHRHGWSHSLPQPRHCCHHHRQALTAMSPPLGLAQAGRRLCWHTHPRPPTSQGSQAHTHLGIPWTPVLRLGGVCM